MVPLSMPAWVVLLLIAGVVVLSFLHVLATGVRNELALHKRKVEVAALRRVYAIRLAELYEIDIPGVERMAFADVIEEEDDLSGAEAAGDLAGDPSAAASARAA